MLALRGDDGQWSGGAGFPADFRGDFSQGQPWTSTLPTLMLLRDLDIDPDAPAVRETVALVRENSRWEHAGQPFFDGEVEPCINGRTVAIGAYFGAAVDGIVARLVGEQLTDTDGGWNCEAENGSIRASFATTGCDSLSPPGGTMTCFGHWTISVPSGTSLIHAWPRRSLCSARNSNPTAPGNSSTPIPARCTSRWRTATGTPVAGTPSAHFEC